jgi:hypothetical protein
MPKKPPARDPIRAYARKAAAARHVGEGKECACGETRAEAFAKGKSKACARCKRKRRGHTTTDKHHVAGEANDPTTISVPVNDHRARLSVDQYDWPKETLENPDGSPILAGAARERGFVDTARYLDEKLNNAEMLECLDKYLVDRLGPKWWENTPLERFAPKPKRDAAP